ncbi:hypothetical protein AB4Z21_10995, partial [Paenibacillus sp. MCAF20]
MSTAGAYKTLVNGHGIVDVASDADGFLYNVDMESGRVNIYDQNGEALFAFGYIDNETQQYGVLGFPTSIGVDSKKDIWIADSRTGTIHKFELTEFGGDVMNALTLYLAGKYEQSEPYWDKVYARNDMYNGTFQGLGKVYLHENNEEEALSFLKTAFDTKGYSKAFWQVRLNWLQNNFLMLASGIIIALLLIRYVPRLVRRQLKRHPLPASWDRPISDLRLLWYVMLHPYHGFY